MPTEIEPLEYQKVTAFKERLQLFDKVNEIVDVINDNGGAINPSVTYGLVSVTILTGTDGLRVRGAGHGIVAGLVGLNNGDDYIGTYNVVYYGAVGMPKSVLCDVSLDGSDLAVVKATITGTVTNHVLAFSLIEDGTETPLKVTSARMTMLEKE